MDASILIFGLITYLALIGYVWTAPSISLLVRLSITILPLLGNIVSLLNYLRILRIDQDRILGLGRQTEESTRLHVVAAELERQLAELRQSSAESALRAESLNSSLQLVLNSLKSAQEPLSTRTLLGPTSDDARISLSLDRSQSADGSPEGVTTFVTPPMRAEHDYLVTRRYRIWYGTDREPIDPDPEGSYYSREFDRTLHLGTCVVHVPKSHQFGQVGSSWIKVKLRSLIGCEDDRLKILEHERVDLSPWQNSIDQDLAHWSRRTALVFIHGYNVSFCEAAIRAAQIGFDLRVDGVTTFFSWPSKGNLVPYAEDEASIELAEQHFVAFIEKLSAVPSLQEINILAHSMGNRLLRRTVEKLAEGRQSGRIRVPIGHLILAAADLTSEAFRQVADTYLDLAKHRVTNYCYCADKPLMVSRQLHGQPRAGLEPPVFVYPGIDTISASHLDLDLLGHSYVASAEPLIYDLAMLVGMGAPPEKRIRLEQDDSQTFWRLTR